MRSTSSMSIKVLLVLAVAGVSASGEDLDWCAERWHEKVCAIFDRATCEASTAEYRTRCGIAKNLGEDGPLDQPATEVLASKEELARFKKKSNAVLDAISMKVSRAIQQCHSGNQQQGLRQLTDLKTHLPKVVNPEKVPAENAPTQDQAQPSKATTESRDPKQNTPASPAKSVRHRATHRSKKRTLHVGEKQNKAANSPSKSVSQPRPVSPKRKRSTGTCSSLPASLQQLFPPGGSGLMSPWLRPAALHVAKGGDNQPDMVRLANGGFVSADIGSFSMDTAMHSIFGVMRTLGKVFCSPLIDHYCKCENPTPSCGDTSAKRSNMVCCGPKGDPVLCGEKLQTSREDLGATQEFFSSSLRKAITKAKKFGRRTWKRTQKFRKVAKKVVKKVGKTIRKVANKIRRGSNYLSKIFSKVLKKLGIAKALRLFWARSSWKIWKFVIVRAVASKNLLNMHLGDMAKLCATELGPIFDHRYYTVAIPMSTWHWADHADNTYPEELQKILRKPNVFRGSDRKKFDPKVHAFHRNNSHHKDANSDLWHIDTDPDYLTSYEKERMLCMFPADLRDTTAVTLDFSLIADIFESPTLIQKYRDRNHPNCSAVSAGSRRMTPLPPLLSLYKDDPVVPEITTTNWNGVKLKEIMDRRQLVDKAGHPHINRFPNNDHYGLLLERRYQIPGKQKWDKENWPLVCAATLSLRNMQCSRCCCKRNEKISGETKTVMMFVRGGHEQMCNDWFVQMAAVFSAATGFARTFTAVVNMHQCNAYARAARECEAAGVVANSNFLWKEKYGLQCGICKGKWRDLADDPHQRVSRVCTDEDGNDMWNRTHVCNMRKTHVVEVDGVKTHKHCYDCRLENPDGHCKDYAAESIWQNDASYRDVTPAQQEKPVEKLNFGVGNEEVQWNRDYFPKGLLRIKGRPGLYSKEAVRNVLDSELRSIVAPTKVR